MCAVIQEHLLPLESDLTRIDSEAAAGGNFICLTLPEGLIGKNITARAITEENVLIAPAAMFDNELTLYTS